jgi:lipopolysaccharide export LptBFGC system permease protein LptF
MRKSSLFLAILCFVIAIIIFVFAVDARRFYSGGFFVLLGVLMLVNSRRESKVKK